MQMAFWICAHSINCLRLHGPPSAAYFIKNNATKSHIAVFEAVFCEPVQRILEQTSMPYLQPTSDELVSTLD